MRHVYECPLRWGDMDMLGHVNNVRYVDYLQEARIDMLAHHAMLRGGEDLAEGVVVVRHDVSYVAPLVFRSDPVRIECWVSDVRRASFTLAHEVYDERPDGSRRVYLRARTELCPFDFTTDRPRRLRPEELTVLESYLEPVEGPGPDLRGEVPTTVTTYDVQVRWSDVDAYRHVNNVTYFDYLQEARLRMLGMERGEGSTTGFENHLVVAQTGVTYRRPVLFRHTPYAVDSWVSRVGGSSFDVDSVIRDPEAADDDAVLARARVSLVGFDMAGQRSAPLTDSSRSFLERHRGLE